MNNGNIKLFISYSHKDEDSIDVFKKHISPLKQKDLIEEWYDRKIKAGEEFNDKIENNLEDADIICLFISPNFISSQNCISEKDKAFELKQTNGTIVIPIILSHCAWTDYEDLTEVLAVPTDGTPVNSYSDKDEAWIDVYNYIKDEVNCLLDIQNLELNLEFKEFLYDTDMLSKAHSNKQNVYLDDIFVTPELDKFDKQLYYEKTVDFNYVLENTLSIKHFVISGEEQSGKTTLCKKLFLYLKDKKYIPVYISTSNHYYRGFIKNKIKNAYESQYLNSNWENAYKDRIVPILDDFHYSKNKEKQINYVKEYACSIVIVDDVYGLNIKDEEMLSSFVHLNIKELKPSLRYELVKNWVSLYDRDFTLIYNENSIYHDIDRNLELIDSTLGKTLGKGIMPSYPFFILSTIFTYETFSIPLSQEITSQGYCYQAFIVYYLKRQGVKADEIDIYFNFLTEIAFYLYAQNKYVLSSYDFQEFMDGYLSKFNLPIKQETLLKNLNQILCCDSFSNIFFRYYYLYYFFVAKYLAENHDQKSINEFIKNIIENLHLNENAYIAVFLAHHSRNVKIIEDIVLEAMCLFDNHNPATLSKDETDFFDKFVDDIIKAKLPAPNYTPENIRQERLKIQDEQEKNNETHEQSEHDKSIDYSVELRRTIKTIEVMGHIVKNRSGSLEKDKLELIIETCINTYLRILSSFFDIIKDEHEQKHIINYILEKLEHITSDENKTSTQDDLNYLAKKLFWNINFFVVLGVINKVTKALGSDKLEPIFKSVCDKIDTPSMYIIKQAYYMWYIKNVNVEELSNRIFQDDFSLIAREVLKHFVADYCSVHKVNYKDLQRIENNLDIPHENILYRHN